MHLNYERFAEDLDDGLSLDGPADAKRSLPGTKCPRRKVNCVNENDVFSRHNLLFPPKPVKGSASARCTARNVGWTGQAWARPRTATVAMQNERSR